MKWLAPALLFFSHVAVRAADAPKPNILVIICDDLGWGDIECYGHPFIKTPHLNQLAADGIRFTSFYSAAPVCSPSRVGLMTGRNPNRAGVYDWIPEAKGVAALRKVKGRERPPTRELVEMRAEEFTIPEMLKSVGYATAMAGKWHCNAAFNSPEQAQPGDHGFDHWFATQNNAAPSHENPINFIRNGEKVGPLQGFSCQIVADEMIAWLERHDEAQPDQPFFAYVAFHEPHEPVASPADLVARHEGKDARNHDEAEYFANVENMDAAVGKLMDALDRIDAADNTLVIFTSDNGPETLDRYRSANRSYGRPGPWRGMKLHTHEAGIRVAGLMRWPGMIPTGQSSDVPVCSLDFLPTFAEISGASLPEGLLLDGAVFLPALQGGEIVRSKPLFWVYYNSLNSGHVAMRDGNFKVLGSFAEGAFPVTSQIDDGNIGALRAAGLESFEIYDLKADPSEANPLPADASPLPAKLKAIYEEALDTFHIWPTLKP